MQSLPTKGDRKKNLQTINANEVLKMVDEVDRFKRRNETARTLLKQITELGDRMTLTYKIINDENYEDDDELMDLNMRISQISEEKRNAEKAYKELMETRFSDFKDRYENIYNMTVREEGIDRNTLKSVLGVYSDYQTGKVSWNEGTNKGLQYTKTKFQLPDDFFNYLPKSD